MHGEGSEKASGARSPTGAGSKKTLAGG